jgi:urease accessory protein UreE
MNKKLEQQAKVPISWRALTQRINRKLKREGKELRSDFKQGFLLIDIEHGVLLDKHVDVEQLAQKLAVLKPWESLEQ